ncbi:divergent polysaccharide deacetylase family protein, partial [Alishewanella longhuensis]
QSTAKHSAAQHNVTLLARHVFLDNEQNQHTIERQFQQLLQIARRHQTAIAIGHPYPETYRFLATTLTRARSRGYRTGGNIGTTT